MTDRDNITLPREVVQDALDALEWAKNPVSIFKTRDSITALRTALAAEQPKPEPVAWMFVNLNGECEQIEYATPPTDDDSITPLYTAPPDIEALRRDAERYREQKERSYRLQRLLKECVKVMQANAVFRDTKAHKDLKTRIRAELEDKT